MIEIPRMSKRRKARAERERHLCTKRGAERLVRAAFFANAWHASCVGAVSAKLRQPLIQALRRQPCFVHHSL
jgi:hypothetical protein